MSASLYDTFGNEINYRITQETLEQYLKDSTIDFVLPEATSELLSELAPQESIDKPLFDAVKSKLIKAGFKEASATAMASILLPVAEQQGVSPLDFFQGGDTALKLAVDTYSALNVLRPPGNRIGLAAKRKNAKTRLRQLIKP